MFKREHKQQRSKKDGLRRLSKHQAGPDEAELREAERRAHSRGSFQRQEHADSSYLPPASSSAFNLDDLLFDSARPSRKGSERKVPGRGGHDEEALRKVAAGSERKTSARDKDLRTFDDLLLDYARSPHKATASSERKVSGRDEEALSVLRGERKALELEMQRRDAVHESALKHMEQELSGVHKQLERSWREKHRLETELERSLEEQRSLADVVSDMQREIDALEQRRPLPPSVDMSFDELNAMHREALARAEAVAAVMEQKRQAARRQARHNQLRTVECLICMDAPVETMLAPCNHILSCAACSAKLATCPICRTYVADRVRVVLS